MRFEKKKKKEGMEGRIVWPEYDPVLRANHLSADFRFCFVSKAPGFLLVLLFLSPITQFYPEYSIYLIVVSSRVSDRGPNRGRRTPLYRRCLSTGDGIEYEFSLKPRLKQLQVFS